MEETLVFTFDDQFSDDDLAVIADEAEARFGDRIQVKTPPPKGLGFDVSGANRSARRWCDHALF
ncbi:MAG: hypothetical protein AAGG48_26925 [Planctomycetota bacterium]